VTVSILVVDDESDMADLFRQYLRREVRQGTYRMHFATSGEDALDKLAGGVGADTGGITMRATINSSARPSCRSGSRCI